MKLPRFVPILTAYAQRVSGRDMAELLRSPTALARALADTQAAIGHDGVLCVFDPELLASACLADAAEANAADGAGEGPLTPPDRIATADPLKTVLDAIEPLRHLLPDNVAILATFTGPGLLTAQLRERLTHQAGDPDRSYAVAVLRNAIRAALERRADGIALIEEAEYAIGPDAERAWRAVRKLVDFYQAGLFAFIQEEAALPDRSLPAHCRFEPIPRQPRVETLAAVLEGKLAMNVPPLTTAGDVPADTEIGTLKSLVPRPGSE